MMEMESMKNMVIQASTTLYSTRDKGERKLAEEWLNDFKKSVHAWFITDQLLHTEKENEQVLFFAAQTIRSKIQYSFQELPADSHESLRNSIFEHVDHLSKCKLSSVQTQIYIALADLVMLMNTWQTPIEDLIKRFSSNSSATIKLKPLINILTILPEEVNNKRLKLGLNRRDQLKRTFNDSSRLVIDYLETCLNQYSREQNELNLIYKCFSSWIEESLLIQNDILNSKLYTNMFSILYNQDTNLELHETITHCINNMLCLYNGCTKIPRSEEPLLISLKDNILKLCEPYKLALQTNQKEKCIDFCLIFTELCNSLVYYLLNEPNTALGDFQCINLLLLCSLHDDYEVFQKTFIFWFNISEDIYRSSNTDLLCKNFRTYVEHLIECVCRHCRLSNNHIGIPPTRNNDFGEFRTKVWDLITDVAFMVDANVCFERLYSILQASTTSWNELEAALFVMCALAKAMPVNEAVCVSAVVQSLSNLPHECHIAVKYTGLMLLGELCNWLNMNPMYIDGCLNFVLNTGFSDSNLCQAAANTMLNICTLCQQHMISHLDILINIVVSSDSINLPSDASLGLLKGAVIILCNLPHKSITDPLMKLCNIQIAGLQRVLNGQLHDGTPKSLPIYWLDRLTAIFRTIKLTNPSDVNPCQPVVEAIWPTLQLCCSKYHNDCKIAESCCKTLRFALRSTEKYSRTILEPLVNLILQSYQESHLSCYLYLGSILIDIYGSEPDFKAGLMQMVQAFTAEAFNFIIKNCRSVDNINDLRKHPDTIDDFFRLTLRFLQRCPNEFIQNSIFTPIMNLAVSTLNLDHRDAHTSVTKFLAEFVALSNAGITKSIDPVTVGLIVSNLLNEISPKIIENSIQSVVNMKTRDTKDGIADLVVELKAQNRKQTEIILMDVLKSLRLHNSNGVEMVNEQQIVAIHSKIMNAISSNDVENALLDLEQLFQ